MTKFTAVRFANRPVPTFCCLLAFAALVSGASSVSAQTLRRPGAAPGAAPGATLGAPTQAAQLGAAPVAPAAQRPADYIVAVVNSAPITNNELRARLSRAEQQLAQQPGAAVPPRAELVRQVLELIINEKAQLDLARESGIKADELAIDEAEANVARQNQIDRAELRRRLAQDQIPLAQFRGELRTQLLLTRLREREAPKGARVSDVEVDQFLREQAVAAAALPIEINLAMLLVAVPENSNEAQVDRLRARAQGVADRARRAGTDFAALEREFSDASDRGQNGGELGLRPTHRYPDLFVEATQALAAGQIAGPVRSGAGFHVLKVLEKRAPGLAPSVSQTKVRHILLTPGPQLSEAAARTRLAEYQGRIQAGQADFAQLAKEHSQDGSARDGGDLGWAVPGQFVPEFEAAMARLKPGEIADPVVSRFGVHLIQVQERREKTISESERRDQARGVLREKKAEDAYNTWAQEVRGRAFVEFREPPSL